MNYIDEAADLIRECIPVDHRPTDRALDLYRLYALLMLCKRSDVTLNDVHDAWSTWMTTTDSDHRSIRPFEDLSERVQREDEPFLEAIRLATRTWSKQRGTARSER